VFCDACQARLRLEGKVKERAMAFWELYKAKLCPNCHFEIWVLYNREDWVIDHEGMPNEKLLRIKPARLRTHKLQVLWHRVPCVDCAYEAYTKNYLASQKRFKNRLMDEALARAAGGHYASEEEFKVRYYEKAVKLAKSLAPKLGSLLVQGVHNPEHRKAILQTYALSRRRAMMDLAKYLKESYCEWQEAGQNCDIPVEKWSKLPYCAIHEVEIKKLLHERRMLNQRLGRITQRQGRKGRARSRQIGGLEN